MAPTNTKIRKILCARANACFIVVVYLVAVTKSGIKHIRKQKNFLLNSSSKSKGPIAIIIINVLFITISDEIVVTFVTLVPAASRSSDAFAMNGHFEGFEQASESLDVTVLARAETRFAGKVWKLALDEIFEHVIFFAVVTTRCIVASFLIPRHFDNFAQVF